MHILNFNFLSLIRIKIFISFSLFYLYFVYCLSFIVLVFDFFIETFCACLRNLIINLILFFLIVLNMRDCGINMFCYSYILLISLLTVLFYVFNFLQSLNPFDSLFPPCPHILTNSKLKSFYNLDIFTRLRH